MDRSVAGLKVPRVRARVPARGAACEARARFHKIDIVEFEFDSQKSLTNKAKHGIDFVEAQALWKSKHVILSAKAAAEKRYLVIGTIEHEH